MEAKTQLLIPPKIEENNVKDEHFHVLAVDDSVIERKMLERLLTISSYHVTCVESGDKALEFLGLVNCHSSVSSSDNDHINHDDHDDHDDVDDHNDDNDGDDDDNNSMICHSLPIPENNAHQQEHVQEGQGARVNLIMTDYSMPGMSGYDLLKRVKESSWKDVPVVVMSSENVPSRIHMCLEEGAEEFLLKPVRSSDLEKLQLRIFKPTPSTTTNTCHCSCERSDNISKEENIITGQEKNEGKVIIKNEMEHNLLKTPSLIN